MEKVNKIVQMLETGQLKEALNEYNHILAKGTVDEKWLLAKQLFQLGFLEEAEKLYHSLLESFPNEGEIMISLAEIYMEQGREDEALDILNTIHKKDPSYPESLLLQADLYQMDGLYEVSEQKLLEAQKILPDELIITFALGELYLEMGRLKDAIDAYEKVLSAHEELAGVNIYQRLADAYSGSGAFEEALAFYEKALKNQLELNTLFQFALTAYQAEKYKLSIQKFKELKSLDHEYHTLYLYLAMALDKEGEAEEALNTVKEGLKYDEFNKDLYFLGAKLALKTGDKSLAEQYLNEAIALDPDFIEAGLLLNELFLSEGRYEDVLKNCEAFVVDELDEGKFIWDQAIAYKHLEQYSYALNKYDQAYNYLKNDPKFLQDYGYFLLEEGKRTKAREIFNYLLQQDPSNEEYIDIVERLTDEIL